MALIKEKRYSNSSNLIEKSEVVFVCPICKTSKSLVFPYSIINEAKQLTTISIHKGLICDHHFQAFVDKNFNVRGYQKVDYEFESKIEPYFFRDTQIEKKEELFDVLILEGNFIKYDHPKSLDNESSKPINNCNNKESNDRFLVLKKIYEEFWEFIDDDNIEFKKFIERDNRRKKASSKRGDLK